MLFSQKVTLCITVCVIETQKRTSGVIFWSLPSGKLSPEPVLGVTLHISFSSMISQYTLSLNHCNPPPPPIRDVCVLAFNRLFSRTFFSSDDRYVELYTLRSQ
jgi:hypothetical protein